ncbi:hypothetical protein AB0C96_42155 [Streptomyces sp. NPDC048506]|uniref:hypothetical protein n=1 Tax=Streptomyces sp. NPDC048506 TaxID=3155028 RepID=UPI003429B469
MHWIRRSMTGAAVVALTGALLASAPAYADHAPTHTRPAAIVTGVPGASQTPAWTSAVGPLGVVQWTRSCGTTYGGFTTSALAETTKGSDGSCQGGAWIRVKWRGEWSRWEYDPSRARMSMGGGIQEAQHKGCATCKVYTTYP